MSGVELGMSVSRVGQIREESGVEGEGQAGWRVKQVEKEQCVCMRAHRILITG